MDKNEQLEKLFLVQHAYYRDEEEEIEEVKTIGIFSSYEIAEEAVEKYKLLEGFNSYPDGFSIGPYILNKGYWEEGFVTVTY